MSANSSSIHIGGMTPTAFNFAFNHLHHSHSMESLLQMQGGHCFGGNKIKDFSRTFKHPHDLFPNLFHRSFHHVTQLLWPHSVSNTDVHCTAHRSPMTAPFLTFKHFQGPLTLNSKTFKHKLHFKRVYMAMKIKKNSENFQVLSSNSDHPANGCFWESSEI